MPCFFIKSIYTRFLPAISILLTIYLRAYVSFISFYPISRNFCLNCMKYRHLENLSVPNMPPVPLLWVPCGLQMYQFTSLHCKISFLFSDIAVTFLLNLSFYAIYQFYLHPLLKITLLFYSNSDDLCLRYDAPLLPGFFYALPEKYISGLTIADSRISYSTLKNMQK